MLPKDTFPQAKAGPPQGSKQWTAIISIPLPSDVRIRKVRQASRGNACETIQGLSRSGEPWQLEAQPFVQSANWHKPGSLSHMASFNRAFMKMFRSSPTS